MIGMREHVERIADPCLVAESAEDPQIARLRLGIAGDVDDSVRGEPRQ